jgi:hypothetical protein
MADGKIAQVAAAGLNIAAQVTKAAGAPGAVSAGLAAGAQALGGGGGGANANPYSFDAKS